MHRAVVLLLLASSISTAAQNPPAAAFRLEEATIADIHAEIRLVTNFLNELRARVK